jgi:16S rRNA (guanine(966)-N(2))-methyltransferase RsmD
VILPPRGLETRPITDRVKESLFAILQHEVPESRVADLFCGTGSLGLEALSRGAAQALMVDHDRDALKRLRQNIANLCFEDQATVVQADAFKVGIPEVVPFAAEDEESWCNLVFVDPPYKLSAETGLNSPLGKLLVRLSEQAAHRAIVVVRHERRTELLRTYQQLHLHDWREYGGMAITFLENIRA